MKKIFTSRICSVFFIALLIIICAGNAAAATLGGIGIRYTGLVSFIPESMLALPAAEIIIELNRTGRVEGVFWFSPKRVVAIGVAYVQRFPVSVVHPYLGIELLFSGALVLTAKGGIEFDFEKGSVYAGLGCANSFEYGYKVLLGFEGGVRYYFGR